MKVCLLTEYYFPDSQGGTPAILSNLTRYLKDQYPDFQLEVITSTNLYRGEAKPLATQEDWNGIQIFRLRTPRSNRPSTLLRIGAGFLFSVAALLRLLSTRRRYDLVFLVTNPPSLPIAALAYKRATRTPYVYLIHDLYPDVAAALGVLKKDGPLAQRFRAFQREWIAQADRAVVLGRCMQDYLATTYGKRREDIVVIPNWSDPDEMQAVDRSESRFRTQHQLEGTVVLYGGNFGQYQNFGTILDAAKLLLQRAAPVTFALVGDGARREYIANRIRAEGISNVRMFPLVSRAEFPDVLAAADVALVTLEAGAEGLGVPSKFYPILAAGRATVAIVAEGSEVARVLAEEECGVQVPQGDAGRLAEVLDELARSPERLAAMNANARRASVEKYTLRHVAEKFYSTFQEVAAQAGRP